MIPYPFSLTTERLLIRSPREEDGIGLREAIADSINELKPWMPWAQSIPPLSQSTENCKNADIAFKEGTDHRLHLFLKETETFIGCSGMHAIDWSIPKAEIGYWIRTPYAGNGYMTEAAREITRYLIEVLDMQRVEIRMSSKNPKSRAIPERLGFNCEGVLKNSARHIDGTLRDTCIYAWTPDKL